MSFIIFYFRLKAISYTRIHHHLSWVYDSAASPFVHNWHKAVSDITTLGAAIWSLMDTIASSSRSKYALLWTINYLKTNVILLQLLFVFEKAVKRLVNIKILSHIHNLKVVLYMLLFEKCVWFWSFYHLVENIQFQMTKLHNFVSWYVRFEQLIAYYY